MRSNADKGSDRTKRFELVFGDALVHLGLLHLEATITCLHSPMMSQDKWIKAIHKKSLMLECFQLFLLHIEETYYSQVTTVRTIMEGEWHE